MSVLIVDDDLDLADVLCFTLRRAGFEVMVAHDGPEALSCWRAADPDLIILDINLPGLNGLSVCQVIRTEAETPIMMLSVRNEEDDIVRGLRLGADDYMVKPFSPRQLVARVEALLRRAGSPALAPVDLVAGNLTLDLSHRMFRWADGPATHLTRLECRLLEVLIRNCNQVLPAEALIDQVWGPIGGDRTMLKQLVRRLRRKIEPGPSDPVYLKTISGVGYELVVYAAEPV